MESPYDPLSNDNSFFEYSQSNFATTSVLPTTNDSDIKNCTESIENLDVYLDFLKTDAEKANDFFEEEKNDTKSIEGIRTSLLEEKETYDKLNEELSKLSREKEEIESELLKSLDKLNKLEAILH
eukprot:TRINITY_DN9572_c0_g1_i4.p1 TRINITY_DN9572_c0_g1~~TRINITY_DN9572_c0_g1_i4.p1  ORF type:complete len:125 (+),score=31.03 TRINITY_DN9572_c0_g1_i4:66-440(+)